MANQGRSGDWAAWMESPGAPPPEREAQGLTTVPPAEAPALAPAPPADPVPVVSPTDPATMAVSPPDPMPVVADVPADAEAGDATVDPYRTPRREATRQRVLDAARDVFAELGVIGATVEAICERAGYTRGAFYSNFADKDDVIDALVEREQMRLLGQLDVALAGVDDEVAGAADLATVLGAIVARVLRAVPIDRELTLVQAELENFAIRRPDLARRFLATNRRFRQLIAGFIADAMARHGRELLVEPAILADAAIGLSQRSVRRALLDGPAEDPDELAAAILPGLLLAFSRPAGARPEA